MRLAVVALFVPSACILVFAAIACGIQAGLSSLANSGPHGLSEILYAAASALGNNGSAFAGLTADTPFYDYMIAAGMFVGRSWSSSPRSRSPGSMLGKKISPASSGTFPTHGPLFTILLVSVILIVSALFFLPALSLGPIAEHMLMLGGRTF